MHLARDGDGYVVHYAIADVAAFITPGDPIDVEAHRRGQTLYGADAKVPLHPTVLSEGAASLLPDQVCPALLWTIKVDATGEGTDVTVERARVSSHAPSSTTPASSRRSTTARPTSRCSCSRRSASCALAREAARGGVSLPLPEQQVSIEGDRWQPRVPRAAADRAVERPDLAAHRHGRRLADGLRPGRPAAHAAAGRPARRAAAAPHRAGAAASTGRPRCSTPTSSDRSTRASRPTPPWSRRARGCCAAAGTSGSSARCPTSRSTARWRRSTPT